MGGIDPGKRMDISELERRFEGASGGDRGVHRLRPALRAPLLGLGLGALSGGLEAVAVGAAASVSAGPVDAGALAAVSTGLGAVLGAALAVPAGAMAELLPRRWLPPARHAFGMSLTALFLGWWHLLPAAADRLAEGIPSGAAAFAMLPLGLTGLVWYNAYYWLRREDFGERRRFGWMALGTTAGLALGGVGAAMLASASQGSQRAFAADPAVIVVAVHGLGVREVGALAADLGGAAAVPTPALDALGARGARFSAALTPTSARGPALAALLTGLHPLRAGVLGEGDPLPLGHLTLPERLRKEEGYAAAAFVSSVAVRAGAGFDQGFAIYDDDRLPGPPGLGKLRTVALLDRALGALPALAGPWWSGRGDAATVDRALAWLGRVGNKPLLALVQLEGPSRAGADRAAAIRALDADVGRLVAAVEAQITERPVIWLVVGTGAAPGVSEAALRVPLILVDPRLRVNRPAVPWQVRLMDVPATIFDALKLEPMEAIEGADIGGFAEGVKQSHYAMMVYAAGASPEAGFRAANGAGDGRVSFHLDLASGAARLYDLAVDPHEQHDLAAEQPAAVEALRARVDAEAGPLRAASAPAAPAWVRARLGG